VIELHAYAVDATWSEEQVRADLMRGMHEAYPETRTMKVLEERFFLRQDCPAFRPGDHASRPGVETAGRGVYLAGDFVKLPFPSALMERAVTSGFMAANAILQKTTKEHVEIRTIKPRGSLAGAPGI
jgi:isorenieratene synthase